MKILVFIAVIALSTAQIYNWTGDWSLWDVLVDDPTGVCCRPKAVLIAHNPHVASNIDISIYYHEKENQKLCPVGVVTLHENIRSGSFEDLHYHATYRPNNDTILMMQFTRGHEDGCRWVLGSSRSRKTNISSANDEMRWEGIWQFTSYPIDGKSSCCSPIFPVILKEDKSTRTVSFISYYPKNSSCPDNLRGHVSTGNESVDGGAFFDQGDGSEGYSLANGSMLVRFNGCVFIGTSEESQEKTTINNFGTKIWGWMGRNILF